MTCRHHSFSCVAVVVDPFVSLLLMVGSCDNGNTRACLSKSRTRGQATTRKAKVAGTLAMPLFACCLVFSSLTLHLKSFVSTLKFAFSDCISQGPFTMSRDLDVFNHKQNGCHLANPLFLCPSCPSGILTASLKLQ